MKITITGGFGFVGSLCADFYRKNGNDVTIITRRIPAELQSWSRNFRVVEADITDKSLDISGDVIIHCAAMNETKNVSMEEFMRVNAEGTKNVLEASVKNSVGKFVKVSTFHVYGTTEGIITEETVPDPKSSYAKSQLAADNVCLDYSKEIDTSVIRLSNIFGPPIHPSIDRWTLVVNNFCLQASRDGKITMKSRGDQKRDFISSYNALSAIDTVAKYKKSGEIFNAGGATVMSIKEIADRVASNFEILYRKKVKVIPGSNEENDSNFSYPIDKINRLGYVPRKDMDRTIKEILGMCDKK